MSLLRDALKRAEQLKREQQQVPSPADATESGAPATISSAHLALTPAAVEPVAVAPVEPLAPAMAEVRWTDSGATNDPLAPDRTTPTRPRSSTVRDRAIPGTLHPATEAIMRRDAENLSLARAAQDLEDLNNINFDRTGRSAPLNARPPAPAPVMEMTLAPAFTGASAHASATATAAAAVAANATTESNKAKRVTPPLETAADLEKFADRDTVKRMMAQRIAAEADAMQSRRNRTFAVGGSVVLALVVFGSWYVWKEASRFDNPVDNAGLPLVKIGKPKTSANAGSSAFTPPPPASQQPQQPPQSAQPLPLPLPLSLPPSPAIATNGAPSRVLPPVNPNIGQLPRPPASTNASGSGSANAAAAGVNIIPPMLNPPTILARPLLPPRAVTAAVTSPPPISRAPVNSNSAAIDADMDATDSAGLNAQKPPRDKLDEPEKLAKNIAAAPTAPPRLLNRSNGAATPPSAALLAGYAALVAGNAASAFASYAQAAQATPDNIDAHLGLAVSAAKLNDLNMARRAFTRVLALDPANAQASAGLLLLSGDANVANSNTEAGNTAESPSNVATFVRQERALKKLLQAAPQSATLNFSLGNLYAAEKRWTDAQQAFFEAFAAEPNNADFSYNLAVSLDQLGQKKIALRYYETATLLKSSGLGGQFSSAQIANRTRELTSELAGVAAVATGLKSEAK